MLELDPLICALFCRSCVDNLIPNQEDAALCMYKNRNAFEIVDLDPYGEVLFSDTFLPLLTILGWGRIGFVFSEPCGVLLHVFFSEL